MVADGTIELETKVNTTGIKNSEGTIKNAAKSVGAEFGKMGQQIQAALNGGSAQSQKLALSMQKTTAQIDAQAKKVDELKAHLSALQSGKEYGTNSTVSGLTRDLDSLDNKIRTMQGKLAQMQALPSFKQDADKIAQTKIEIDKAIASADALGARLRNAEGAATQVEIDKTNAKLQQESIKLDELKLKAQETGNKLRSSMTGSTDSVNAVTAGIDKFGNRIVGLAKRVFVFSMITRGLRMVRETLGNLLMADEGFRQSLYQLQAALYTAFAPIYSFILPAIQTLVNWITAAINAIVQFIAMLTGKSFAAMVGNGKALKNQADAYKNVGAGGASAAKGMKKATDEAKKQIAAFDELNILSQDKADADGGSGGGGGAGGGGGGAASGFEGLEWDASKIDEIIEKMKGIAILVGSIGAGLLAWKISEFIKTLAAGGAEAAALKSKIAGIAGWLMIIVGAILSIKGYSDAWVNGIDWQNFAEIIGGLALVIGGIALAISPVAAAFAAMGAAIAVLVLGVKDFIQNGASFQNILMILIGLAALFAAAWFAAGLPLAIILTTIAALTAAFVILWNKSEGFRQFWINLWETVKNTFINIWNNSIKPAFDKIKESWSKLMDAFRNLWDAVSPLFDEIGALIAKVFGAGGDTDQSLDNSEKSFKLFETIVDTIIKSISNIITGIIDTLTGVINFLANVFEGDWEGSWNAINDVIDGFFTFFDGIFGEGSSNGIRTILHGILGFLQNVFEGDWDEAWGVVKATINSVLDLFDNIFGEGTADGIREKLRGIIGFIKDVFNGNWENAWNTVKTSLKTAVNNMIDLFERGMNKIIALANKISFNLPDIMGGGHVGFNIPSIHIPRLAQGAVLPPNKPFLAMVGDQKHGTNIEAPLETMIEAFTIALESQNQGSGSTVIPLILNGRELGRAVIDTGSQELRRTKGSGYATKVVFG